MVSSAQTMVEKIPLPLEPCCSHCMPRLCLQPRNDTPQRQAIAEREEPVDVIRHYSEGGGHCVSTGIRCDDHLMQNPFDRGDVQACRAKLCAARDKIGHGRLRPTVRVERACAARKHMKGHARSDRQHAVGQARRFILFRQDSVVGAQSCCVPARS